MSATPAATPRDDGRIAVLIATMGSGGAERSMVRLAAGLARTGRPTDLVLGCRAEDAYADELSDDVRVVRLGASRALLSLPRLVAYLRRERPVAMVSSLDYMNVIAVVARWLARVDTRLVVNEQNTLSMESGHSAHLRQRLVPALVRRSYPRADEIAAVSAGVADDLATVMSLPRRRVRVINNPVVVPELAEMVAQPCDHPWLAVEHPPVLLAVGRLAPQKDFESLLRAFATVRASTEARLLILGEGPDRNRLETLVAQLGLTDCVQLPGWVGNPYPYMARSDVFVLSSRWEGLPTVLIEALYCGMRIVSTDCPSGPQEILEGGRWGALVPVGDPDALAAAILETLRDEGPAPTSQSWERYGQQAVTEQYLDALVGP
jgi:glycosyltransferase involved in cell wall biosynthesis